MRPRRLCALVMVLALLTGISPTAPRGCVQCPPGCPMHARRADEAPGARTPGCHRAPAAPSDVVCLRSACGHDVVTDAPVSLVGLVAAERVPPPAVVPTRRVPADTRRRTRAAPEPPTRPPRVVVG